MTPPVTTSTSVTITRIWYRYLFDLSRCCLWLILTYFWWLNPATMFARLFDPNGVVETVMIVGRLKLRDQMLISTNCRFTKPFHSKLGIFTQLWFISRWTLCGGTKSTSRLPAAQAWIRPYWQIPSQGNSLLRNFQNCEEESFAWDWIRKSVIAEDNYTRIDIQAWIHMINYKPYKFARCICPYQCWILSTAQWAGNSIKSHIRSDSVRENALSVSHTFQQQTSGF